MERMKGNWEKKVKRTQINTYRKGINTGMNCHHVLEINQHKCHCWCKDSVNKHRFLHSADQQTRYSIDIHSPPMFNKQQRNREKKKTGNTWNEKKNHV